MQIEWKEGQVLQLEGISRTWWRRPVRVWKQESIFDNAVMESAK